MQAAFRHACFKIAFNLAVQAVTSTYLLKLVFNLNFIYIAYTGW